MHSPSFNGKSSVEAHTHTAYAHPQWPIQKMRMELRSRRRCSQGRPSSSSNRAAGAAGQRMGRMQADPGETALNGTFMPQGSLHVLAPCWAMGTNKQAQGCAYEHRKQAQGVQVGDFGPPGPAPFPPPPPRIQEYIQK